MLRDNYRGKTDLLRLISRERIEKVESFLETSFLGFNEYLKENITYEPGILMEIIDIIPIKYDIVNLSDGERILILNEQDVF